VLTSWTSLSIFNIADIFRQFIWLLAVFLQYGPFSKKGSPFNQLDRMDVHPKLLGMASVFLKKQLFFLFTSVYNNRGIGLTNDYAIIQNGNNKDIPNCFK